MDIVVQQIIDLVKNAWRIHVAASIVRIPPSDIQVVAKHTAINTGTATFAAILIFVANSLVTPFNSLGVPVAFVVSILSLLVIVLFGFAVNILSPASETFHDDDEGRAAVRANRWGTYLFVSFIVMVLIFMAITQAALALGIHIDYEFAQRFHWTGDSTLTVLCFFSSFLAVSVILARCYAMKTIRREKIGAVLVAFFVGAILNALLFRHLAFG